MIACGAALLPLSQAQAASPAGRNYYGLAPGKTFSLKVSNVVATKATLTGAVKTKVPTGIPKYAKGQTITFTIGSRGELKGPGFTTAFKSATARDSLYLEKQVGSNLPDGAVVRKDSKLKPVFTELVFYKTTGAGTMSQAVYFVVYTLQ